MFVKSASKNLAHIIILVHNLPKDNLLSESWIGTGIEHRMMMNFSLNGSGLEVRWKVLFRGTSVERRLGFVTGELSMMEAQHFEIREKGPEDVVRNKAE